MRDMDPVTPFAAALMVGGGIALLGLGSNWLVSGASRLALRLGVSSMVVGLTVVGFGTSMPEFSVSVLAAARGSGGLSLGNAVGSNIMNLLLVLGMAAVIKPIHVTGARRGMYRDLVFGVLPAIVLVLTARAGFIGRGTALVLVVIFVVFLLAALQTARGERSTAERTTGAVVVQLAITTVGIAVLLAGAELMVRGGVGLAHHFGISDAVIGLTLVAFGTSLPELATSVAASFRGEAELSVGNVLGSNVFNLGLIVGTAFAIRPGAVPHFVIHQDVPILVGATLIVGLGILRDGRISRMEGALMLLMFVAYATFLFLRGG